MPTRSEARPAPAPSSSPSWWLRPRAVLGAILLVALAVRVVAIRHGLPYAYNADEELHYVPLAAAAADGDWRPDYFENPSGYTYVLGVVFAVVFPGRDVRQLLLDDPTAVFTVARLVTVVIGTASVAAVYAAGRRFFGAATAGWSALFVAVSFLPVFYAHHALNDAVTLLPLALALWACLSVYQRGDSRSLVLAGGLVGLASGVKYLAAPMSLVVALALLARVVERRQRVLPALGGLVVAAAACVTALVVTNPFLALDLGTFWNQFAGQSTQAGTTKLGQSGSGWLGYPQSLLWGFGVVPVALALAGAVLAWRHDRARALLLVAFPVLLYVAMAGQGRYFGRWLLPAYPALAILAGYAMSRLVGVARSRWPSAGPAAVLVLATIVFAQPLADVVRSDVLLGRTDTRQRAMDWVRANVPGGVRMVVEPSVPESYLRDLRAHGIEVYEIERPFQAYQSRLDAPLIDEYRSADYCWVMVNGHQRERGTAAGVEAAERYYQRLEAESELLFDAAPYARGVTAPDFSYDFSFNYYPPAFERPGPTIMVFRLGDC